MSAAPMLMCALVVLVVVGGFGLRLVLEACERRRSVRWAHLLTRFCGDPSCGVCRSRSLSAQVPRIPTT